MGCSRLRRANGEKTKERVKMTTDAEIQQAFTLVRSLILEWRRAQLYSVAYTDMGRIDPKSAKRCAEEAMRAFDEAFPK